MKVRALLQAETVYDVNFAHYPDPEEGQSFMDVVRRVDGEHFLEDPTVLEEAQIKTIHITAFDCQHCDCSSPDNRCCDCGESKLPKVEQGLFPKFIICRTDGRDAPGEKHHGCFTFTLDIDHDPHARAALSAYAESIHRENPTLASQLRQQLITCGKNEQ